MSNDDNTADKPAKPAQEKPGVNDPEVIVGDQERTMGVASDTDLHTSRIRPASAPSALSSTVSGMTYEEAAKRAKQHKPRDRY